MLEPAAAGQDRSEEAEHLIDHRDLIRRTPAVRQSPLQNVADACSLQKLERQTETTPTAHRSVRELDLKPRYALESAIFPLHRSFPPLITMSVLTNP